MSLRFAALLLSVALAFAHPDDILSTWPIITASNNTECSNPRPNDCSFYTQCLQSRYHCATSDYPLGYGQKYCEKFQADASFLSTKGQTWMETVMLCLQRDLVPYALGGPQVFTNCSALGDYAFSTHPKCYVQSGLCTLPIHDWEVIVFQIVGVETLFDSWDAIRATVEAVSGCAEFYLWAIEHGIFSFHGEL